ncbi:hypothetical protein A3F66_02095 [candidate division TM6 bacterium RIFCSPHIGHO2_12_FULL_32_22]|nr:MAG: hypothetical protein A3F66_02095 [candidate division TM6 bacterium RIFCSPHIGHO2_12_FULL_32_22]
MKLYKFLVVLSLFQLNLLGSDITSNVLKYIRSCLTGHRVAAASSSSSAASSSSSRSVERIIQECLGTSPAQPTSSTSDYTIPLSMELQHALDLNSVGITFENIECLYRSFLVVPEVINLYKNSLFRPEIIFTPKEIFESDAKKHYLILVNIADKFHELTEKFFELENTQKISFTEEQSTKYNYVWSMNIWPSFHTSALEYDASFGKLKDAQNEILVRYLVDRRDFLREAASADKDFIGKLNLSLFMKYFELLPQHRREVKIPEFLTVKEVQEKLGQQNYDKLQDYNKGIVAFYRKFQESDNLEGFRRIFKSQVYWPIEWNIHQEYFGIMH